MTASEERIGNLRYSISPTFAGRDPEEVRQEHAAAVRAQVSGIVAEATAQAKVSLTAKDSVWGDESYYNPLVDFTLYPYWIDAHRSNDGTFDDPQWPAAYARAVAALNAFGTVQAPNPHGLALHQVYAVYRPNWQDAVANLYAQVPVWHPRMFPMWDGESWGGAITGNQSAAFKACIMASSEELAAKKKITTAQAFAQHVGYSNGGDRDSLFPQWPAGLKWLYANYSTATAKYAYWAHQYSSSVSIPGRGPGDINSKDGATVLQTAQSLGIALPTATPPSGPYYHNQPTSIISADGQYILFLGDDGVLYKHARGQDDGRVELVDLQNLVAAARANGTLK